MSDSGRDQAQSGRDGEDTLALVTESVEFAKDPYGYAERRIDAFDTQRLREEVETLKRHRAEITKLHAYQSQQTQELKKKHQEQLQVLAKQMSQYETQIAELVKFKHFVEVLRWMKK